MIIIITIIALFVIFLPKYIEYKTYMESTYYKETGLPFSYIKNNIGKCGEYVVYKNLMAFENDGAKFLFNCYIHNGRGYTEIDLIMIHHSGLYVFESKNYSGWIFGDDKSQYWTQTLPSGSRSKKYKFYNPIKQNDGHISALKRNVGDYPYHSFIVFSNRCEFKKISNKRSDVFIIHRGAVESRVLNCSSLYKNSLSNEDITKIYNKLYPYTKVSNDVKRMHIENINR